MSWLARMELSRDALARCRFRDAYAWHQAVWDCFPGRPDADRDFLTRMDWLPQGAPPPAEKTPSPSARTPWPCSVPARPGRLLLPGKLCRSALP